MPTVQFLGRMLSIWSHLGLDKRGTEIRSDLGEEVAWQIGLWRSRTPVKTKIMCQLVSTPSTSVFSPNISRWVALRLHLIMLGCLIFENYTDHDQFHVWIRQQSRNMAFVDLINIQIQMQVARVENIRCNVSLSSYEVFNHFNCDNFRADNWTIHTMQWGEYAYLLYLLLIVGRTYIVPVWCRESWCRNVMWLP